MPDGDGEGERLSYSFWVRPDDGFAQNWVRTKTVNQAAAATAGNGEQMWNFGEVRDFRLRVTSTDVEWFLRSQPTAAWTQVRDPLDTDNTQAYDGSETGGRSTFGVFVHASSAGSDGAANWTTSDLRIDRILVDSNIAPAGPNQWAVNSDGDWQIAANWTGGVPTAGSEALVWRSDYPTANRLHRRPRHHGDHSLQQRQRLPDRWARLPHLTGHHRPELGASVLRQPVTDL